VEACQGLQKGRNGGRRGQSSRALRSPCGEETHVGVRKRDEDNLVEERETELQGHIDGGITLDQPSRSRVSGLASILRGTHVEDKVDAEPEDLAIPERR